MHQTTYGETLRKIRVVEGRSIGKFLEKNKIEYEKLTLGQDCLYKNNLKIEDPVLNYLNVEAGRTLDNQLKYLIRNEYEKLESLYPKLGSIFVDYFFKEKNTATADCSLFKLHESNASEFYNSLDSKIVQDIVKLITRKGSLEYSVNIEQHLGSDVLCRKTKNINFFLEYDSDFLGTKQSHEMNNYSFIVIDGMIESVSEIHHLLFEASQNKRPYVIFCFGISPEVKHVIIENNKKSITEVFPVCLKFKEETINILNDLAIVLGCDVVTAQKGQTISQEVRKSLPIGKKIVLNRSGFLIEPNIDEVKLIMHRKFLERRISETSNNTNSALLKERLKRLSSKIFNIYLPASISKNSKFLRELDYSLRFLTSASLKMKKIKLNNKQYFIPDHLLPVVDKSVESLKKTYNSIDKIMIFDPGGYNARD